MSEAEELPAVSPEAFVNKKELDVAARGAIAEIKEAEASPIKKAGTAAGELGFFATLGEIARSHLKEGVALGWKDAKVGGISFIGLVPYAKELSAPTRAMRQADKAAYYVGKAEKAIVNTKTKQVNMIAWAESLEHFANEEAWIKKAVEAIPKGSKAAQRLEQAVAAKYGAREALYFAQHGFPPKGTVEKGIGWVKHVARTEIPKLIDPFPDVPDSVKKAAGVFDLVSFGSTLVALLPPAAPVAAPIAAVSGMIGVGVPAAWQFVHNRVEAISLQSKTEEKVANLVKDTVKKRLGWTKSPEAKQAAQAFHPAAQPAYA